MPRRYILNPGEVVVEEPFPWCNSYIGEIVDTRWNWFRGKHFVIKYEKNNVVKYCVARKLVDDTSGGVGIYMYYGKRDIKYNEINN